MTTLSDLIARLADTKEGSRELDAEIALALNQSRAPTYTTSLDAALTLVPKGYFGEIDFDFLVDKQAAWVRKNNDTPRVIGYGKTPALALCIAALKAREAAR